MDNILPRVQLVNTPAALAHIRATLAMAWQRKQMSYNPAPKPVNLLRADMKRVLTDDYVVADKTDGYRALVVLTRIGTGQNIACFVDSNMQCYQVEVEAPQSFFAGTVLDAELVVDHQKQLVCLCFDMVRSAGHQHQESAAAAAVEQNARVPRQ